MVLQKIHKVFLRGRVKKALASAALLFALQRSAQAQVPGKNVAAVISVKESNRTDEARKELSTYYNQLKQKESWTDDDALELAKRAAFYGKLLREDIILHLKTGEYDAARIKFKKFESVFNIVDSLKYSKFMLDDYLKITAAFKSAAARLETNSSRMPPGTYGGKSENFSWKLVAVETGDGVLVTLDRKGVPMKEGEFEKATAGAPKQVVDFVRKSLKERHW